MRIRIGLEGSLWKVVPIKWTFIAEDVPEDKEAYAIWTCALLNDRAVSANPLKGKIFAKME